jgi:truncated hemoglobin YjbI
MACMTQALHECGIDTELALGLCNAFQGTADWMRNRAG